MGWNQQMHAQDKNIDIIAYFMNVCVTGVETQLELIYSDSNDADEFTKDCCSPSLQ